MLIKNRLGRIVEVPEQLAQEMVKRGEATIIDETPKQQVSNQLECPYCFKAKDNFEQLNEHKKKCKERELISVIIPSRPFEEIITLDFLEKQTYENYEIITVIDRKKEGANVCRNRGAKKAKGKYLLFCDNDITWERDALQVLYKALKENPKASYSYCSYTLDGKLVGNKEFSTHDLWKWNYISTMSLLRKEDFDGFDPNIKRFQDWDLWLGLLNRGKVGVYCGRTLFKTKIREGITYGKETEDPNAAREKVLKKYNISDSKLADIIIPHQNRHDLLKNTLDRLSHDNFNVFVIEGGTFAHNCNQGAKIAETDTLIFMNDDIEPNDDVIREMLNNPADICGAAQITPSWHPEKIWQGIEYEWKNDFINERMTESYEKSLIPTGFLFRVKKSVWEALGGFNEEYKNGGEDQDLFLRALESGFTVDICKIPTIHHHSSSRDRFKYTSDNRTKLNKEWTKERIRKLLDKKNESTINPQGGAADRITPRGLGKVKQMEAVPQS